MRFVLTTRYGQDVDVFRHGGERFWYGLLGLAVLAAPWVVSPYNVGELALVFIWAIAGIGLMLLVGYTGLVSLGHAAFFAIGAYSHAVLLGYGVPFVVSVPVAVVLTAGVGALVGIPALRMTGVYLAVATLAFERIVAFTIEHSDPLTGGLRGMTVEQPSFFREHVNDQFLLLSVLRARHWSLGAKNLLRSPTGAPSWSAGFGISAESMGVHLARTKTTAFAVSAGFTGLAGTLFAHKAGYLAPDAFTVQTSIQLLLLVVVGGLGSLHGVVFGAIFVGYLPQAIAVGRDVLPAAIGQIPGLELGVFGAILVLFLVFEPSGIYGRWLKIRAWFDQFPLYRKATHKRQKSYLRTERVH